LKRILTSTFILLLLLTATPQSAKALLQKGAVLPDLSGETLAGEPFNSSSLKDTKFVLKLGTTWCGTCGEQVKEIAQLRDFLQEKHIKYIDVFIQEDAETVGNYFQKQGLQLPDQTILDGGRIARQLNVYVIPRLLIVDKGLRVLRDGANLSKAELKKLLSEESPED